ncbi:unnamed protein product [Calypogeia fissa]
MDLGDTASTVAVLELGDLQGRLHDFQLPPHVVTEEHLKGPMAAFTSGFCTREISNVDMDFETTSEESLTCTNKDAAPLAIVKCLAASDKELPSGGEEELDSAKESPLSTIDEDVVQAKEGVVPTIDKLQAKSMADEETKK